MMHIDGDRLKEFLDETEKTLKRIDDSDQESWDNDDKAFWKMYVHAIGKTFKFARETIDRIPTLETRGEN